MRNSSMVEMASGMSGFAEGSVLHGPAADSRMRFRQFKDPTLETAKCDLARQVLRSFGILRLVVTGSSMLPSLWPGDLLLIHRQDLGRISTGDIVLFARLGRFFAHRVISSGAWPSSAQVVTRGDALLAPDPPVTSAELLGKVSLVFRAGKWIVPRAGLGFGGSLLAALVSRSARAARLLLWLHSIGRIRREQEASCAT